MTIEIFAWCSSRELFITGMTTTTFPDGSTLATLSEDGNLIPHEGVIIDEIGAIEKTPAVMNPDGSIQTPALMVPGFHVNLMATGELADMLTAGCPAAGTIFERTNISSLMPGMKWDAVTKDGVPAGFVQPDTGVRLFDPADVKSPARVFL
jgi:hypothetical protein